MQIFRLFAVLACLAYLALLTVLLLTPDPESIIRIERPWGDRGVHFVAFTGLALLVHATRWPKGVSWLLVAFLIAYGLATESLQALVPHRTVELLDYTENLLGALAGSLFYWFVWRILPRPSNGPELAAALVRDATGK